MSDPEAIPIENLRALVERWQGIPGYVETGQYEAGYYEGVEQCARELEELIEDAE